MFCFPFAQSSTLAQRCQSPSPLPVHNTSFSSSSSSFIDNILYRHPCTPSPGCNSFLCLTVFDRSATWRTTNSSSMCNAPPMEAQRSTTSLCGALLLPLYQSPHYPSPCTNTLFIAQARFECPESSGPPEARPSYRRCGLHRLASGRPSHGGRPRRHRRRLSLHGQEGKFCTLAQPSALRVFPS